MGGERASKVRQRERGEICYKCERWIYVSLPPLPGSSPTAPPPSATQHVPGYARRERLCAFCECSGRLHVVYFLRGARRRVPDGAGGFREQFDGEWVVQFLAPDCARNFGRFHTLWGKEAGADAIRRLVASGKVHNARPSCTGLPWDLESELRNGRGGVTLEFDWPQFNRLTTRGERFPKE